MNKYIPFLIAALLYGGLAFFAGFQCGRGSGVHVGDSVTITVPGPTIEIPSAPVTSYKIRTRDTGSVVHDTTVREVPKIIHVIDSCLKRSGVESFTACLDTVLNRDTIGVCFIYPDKFGLDMRFAPIAATVVVREKPLQIKTYVEASIGLSQDIFGGLGASLTAWGAVEVFAVAGLETPLTATARAGARWKF